MGGCGASPIAISSRDVVFDASTLLLSKSGDGYGVNCGAGNVRSEVGSGWGKAETSKAGRKKTVRRRNFMFKWECWEVTKAGLGV